MVRKQSIFVDFLQPSRDVSGLRSRVSLLISRFVFTCWNSCLGLAGMLAFSALLQRHLMPEHTGPLGIDVHSSLKATLPLDREAVFAVALLRWHWLLWRWRGWLQSSPLQQPVTSHCSYSQLAHFFISTCKCITWFWPFSRALTLSFSILSAFCLFSAEDLLISSVCHSWRSCLLSLQYFLFCFVIFNRLTN